MLVWPITYLHVEKGMTVYIVQEMRGRDLSDAVTFGDIEVLIPASEQASFSTQPLIRQLTRKLSKFTDDDYLLLSGDPVIIGLAASIASRYNMGRYKILKWDRLDNKYYPLEANFNE